KYDMPRSYQDVFPTHAEGIGE
ncbi:hypothetical protein BMETH_359415321917, partial [methanotrophic bacterial endosymbiont of Bathymodiolus sp.]